MRKARTRKDRRRKMYIICCGKGSEKMRYDVKASLRKAIKEKKFETASWRMTEEKLKRMDLIALAGSLIVDARMAIGAMMKNGD